MEVVDIEDSSAAGGGWLVVGGRRVVSQTLRYWLSWGVKKIEFILLSND